MHSRFWCLIAIVGLLSFLATGESFGAESKAIDFTRDIEPVFTKHCLKCHGPDKQKSKFRLDRAANLLRGGDSGEPAVVPGKPDASFLLKLIKHEESEMEMPPKGDPLMPEQIALISRWVAEGAKTPAHYGPAKPKVELTHWSFQPIRQPQPADNIDHFVVGRLAKRGLSLSPKADRRTLIRRLYLVMHGLPPTPEQVTAFLKDKRPNAWGNLVDQVLQSPRYGERLGTLWLDLARFGETHGFEMNRERSNAWPYRDWVISSFNTDMPYNDFVRAQLAGDAIGVDLGTGFLVAGPVDQVKGQDPKLRLTQRMNELDDMINTTGTTLLGLTTGCARCHNHKFDPISQADYYSMQAIFAGVKHSDRTLPPNPKIQAESARLGREISDLKLKLKRFIPKLAKGKLPPVNAKHNIERFSPRKAKYIRFTIESANGAPPCIDELEIFAGGKNVALATAGAKASSSGDFKHPLHKLTHINDGVYGNSRSWILAGQRGWVQIELSESKTIERIEWARDREGKYSDRLATRYRIEGAMVPGKWSLLTSSNVHQLGIDKFPTYDFASVPPAQAVQGQRWKKQLTDAVAEKQRLSLSRTAYIGAFGQPGPTHRLYRGEPDAKREQVAPGGIAVLASLKLDFNAPEQKRRAVFADWVVSDNNPLTARVMANRLWQFHFGTGIVDTPSDFGANGTPPSHPLLLDWLAAELVVNDWSLKHLHRSILMSKTWQQDSRPTTKGMTADASTRLLWRYPTRRLNAEGIRDSIVMASGVLDQTMGGPGFSAFRVEKENVRHYHPKENFGPEDWRRMIYMTKVRQERDAVFGAFDCPDASQAVPKRSRSTTPLQALNLINSAFVMQQAQLLAKRLEADAKTDKGRVERAWSLCFQRPPTQEDIDDSLEFIEEHGLIQFARAMLNANEMFFIP